jgi:hypothetical protein
MGLVNFLIKIGLDTTDVQLGTKRVESAFTGMGNKLSGALSVTALAGFAKSLINTADAIGDLAEQANESTDNIQRLQTLAAKSGVEVEKYIQALFKMGEARNKALAGDEASNLILGRFGLTGDDLRSGQSNLDLLIKVGVEFDKQKDSISAQADAADLLGIRMAKVLTTIKGINDLGPRLSVSSSTVKSASFAEDAAGELWRSFKAGLLEYGLGPTSVGGVLVNALRGKVSGTSAADEFVGPRQEDQKSAAQIIAERKAAEKDPKMKAAKRSEMDLTLFRSSNPDAGAAGGAFYFGADRQARLDIGQRTLAVQEKVLTEVKAMRGEVQTLLRP